MLEGVIVVFVAQVLVECGRIIIFDSSASAIAPSSSLQIITGSTFRVNFRRRGRRTAVKDVIIIMVVFRLFL